MKYLLPIFICSLFFQTAHAQKMNEPDDVYATMSKAYQNLDAKLIKKIYTEDAYYLSPSSNIRKGTNNFISDFENMFADAKANNRSLDIQFEITNRKKLGKKTFLDVGIYTLTSNTDGKKGISKGKFTTLLEKNKINGWQFSLDTYNGLAPAPSVEPASSRIPENIIRDNIKQFSQDLVNQDFDKIVAAYTEDASIFPNGAPILKGHEAIRNYWTPKPENKNRISMHQVTPEEISVKGRLAYDYGYYEGKTRLENGEETAWKGKYLIVWKEVDLGVWKIYLDIWNQVRD